MISLPQLEYIIALDTHRHFVIAAKHCFVTQPTLSMQIKKLEEDLDVIIFDRSRHPIEPTDLGREIIDQARIIISETSKVKEIIQKDKTEVSGELFVGVIPTIAPYLLPRFIGKFMKDYPNVRIKIQELLTDEIIERLENGSIDVGILVTPLNEKSIKESFLYYEPMVLYVNKDHNYNKLDHIQADSLSTNDIWLLKEGHCFRSQVLNVCSKEKATSSFLNIEYESGSLETLMKFVEKEGGYTLLPQLAVDKDHINPNAHIIKFSNEQPHREVSLVYSRLYTKKRLLDLFSKYIKEAVPPEMLKSDPVHIVAWR